MKIRSLLLGSVAAAGLSTGAAYAADLGVLTSLDVCDSLGLSGLTISSDTNCLQITGEVKYKFTWGDYDTDASADIEVANGEGSITFIDDNGGNDWESRFDAWIKFVATASSDFGPAKAVLKLKEVDDKTVKSYSYGSYTGYTYGYSGTATGTVTVSSADLNGDPSYATVSGTVASVTSTNTVTYASGISYNTSVNDDDTNGVVLDEAYVSIGDSTVISAGKKGSIMNKGDDVPLNWLGLFNAAGVPAAPINSVEKALRHPLVAEHGMRLEIEGVPQLGSALNLSLTPVEYRQPPPRLGQHSDELALRAGCDPAALRASGVIR